MSVSRNRGPLKWLVSFGFPFVGSRSAVLVLWTVITSVHAEYLKLGAGVQIELN